MEKFLCATFLLILASSADTLTPEESQKCWDKAIADHCDKSKLYPGYPKNAEELLQICKDDQEFSTCYVNAVETCEDQPINTEFQRKSVDYLKSVCKEDNPLFKVISSNLQCMEPVFRHLLESPACYKIYGNESRTFFLKNSPERGDEEDRRSEFEKCAWTPMYSACEALTYGQRCGAEVRDAVENLSNNYYGLARDCDKLYPEIAPVVAIYKTMLLKEM